MLVGGVIVEDGVDSLSGWTRALDGVQEADEFGPLHRQAGLSAIEGLDLALFIDAEHRGVRRGIDIEAEDVAQIADELGVLRQLELAHTMRLKLMCAQDALH